MTKAKLCVPSSDKVHTLNGVVYLPEGEARGYFHIVHGMTEHIGRYDRIMTDLAEEGYICFGYDNLGHGYTVRDKSELGYIAKKGGDDLLMRDVGVFSCAVMEKYGKKPYYLMGHSMGSFITRLAVGKYVKPDKYICMGTGGKNPAAGAGLVLIALIKLFRGDRHISPLVDKLAFGSYNDRFGGATAENPAPWLSADGEAVKKYSGSELCTFKFTVSAMGDLIRMNRNSNKAAWYKGMSRSLPILLVSGDCDPVGDYGKGVMQVYEGLKKRGCDVQCKLYAKGRHEILNDFTYGEVKSDILEFIK